MASANRLLWRQAATAIKADSEAAGAPATNALLPPLDFVYQAAPGTYAATIRLATSALVLGQVVQEATLANHQIADLHPNNYWYLEARSSTLTIHKFSPRDGAVNVATASSYTAAGAIREARFSRTGGFILICWVPSSGTNRNGGWGILQFNPATGVIGALLTPPTDTGSSNTYTKAGADWLPNDLGVAVWGIATDAAAYRVRVYPFAPATGTISAHVASERDVGSPNANPSAGHLVACRRVYDASTSYVFVASTTSPYAYALSITCSSGTPTALAAATSPSALPGASEHVAVSPNDAAVLFGFATSPYGRVFPFPGSWSAAYSDPATAIGATVFNGAWSPDGAVLVLIAGTGTGALQSYVWNAGWGAKELAFDPPASGNTRRALAISADGQWVVTSLSTDVLLVTELDSTADRKARPWDMLFLEATTLEIGATVQIQAYTDLAESVSTLNVTVPAFARTGSKNLLSDPQDIGDGPGWTQNSVTPTTEAKEAPNGEMEGDLLKATGASGSSNHTAVTVSASTAYVVSACGAVGTQSWLWLHVDCGSGNAATLWGNCATGAVGTVADPGALTGVAALTPERDPDRPDWWRFKLAFTTAAGTTTCTVKIGAAAADNTAPANNDSIYAWGADLRLAADEGRYCYEPVPVTDKLFQTYRRNFLHVRDTPVLARVVKITLTNAASEPRVAFAMIGKAWAPQRGLPLGLDLTPDDASTALTIRGGARTLVPGEQRRHLSGVLPILTVEERALAQELTQPGIAQEIVICRNVDSARARFTDGWRGNLVKSTGLRFPHIHGELPIEMIESS